MAIESCKIREKYQWPKFYQKQFNFSYFQKLKWQDLNCFFVSRVELSCNLFDAPIMYSCPAKTEGQNDLQSLHVSLLVQWWTHVCILMLPGNTFGVASISGYSYTYWILLKTLIFKILYFLKNMTNFCWLCW